MDTLLCVDACIYIYIYIYIYIMVTIGLHNCDQSSSSDVDSKPE